MIVPDFDSVWNNLLDFAEKSGDSGLSHILRNHVGRKEMICRKLGAVSVADVNRIIENRASKKSRKGRK